MNHHYFTSGKPFLAVSYPHNKPKSRGVWLTFKEEESAVKWLKSKERQGYKGKALIKSFDDFNALVAAANEGLIPGSVSLLGALHHYAVFVSGTSIGCL